MAFVIPLPTRKKKKRRTRISRIIVVDLVGDTIRLADGRLIPRSSVVSIDTSTGEVTYIDPYTREIVKAKLWGYGEVNESNQRKPVVVEERRVRKKPAVKENAPPSREEYMG